MARKILPSTKYCERDSANGLKIKFNKTDALKQIRNNKK